MKPAGLRITHQFGYWLEYPTDDAELVHPDSYVDTAVVSADGRWLFTGLSDGMIICWDLMTNEVKHQCQTPHTWRLCCLASNSGFLVSGGWDTEIFVWDAHTFQLVRELAGHSHAVFSVNFNHSGTLILSCSADRTLRLWSVDTGDCLGLFEGRTDQVISAQFLSDDRIISGSNDGSVVVWSKETARCERSFTASDPFLSVSSDGSMVACVFGVDRRISIYDSEDWNVLRTLDQKGSVACFHPLDPGVLAVGFVDTDLTYSVNLLNVANEQLFRSFKGFNDRINAVCFTPDGTRLFIAFASRSVRVYIQHRISAFLYRVFPQLCG